MSTWFLLLYFQPMAGYMRISRRGVLSACTNDITLTVKARRAFYCCVLHVSI
jgi:hypothetical protein